MSNYPTFHHKQLLKLTGDTSSDDDNTRRKKRRRGITRSESPEVIELTSESGSPSSDEFETVNLNAISEDSDDSDEFEDVDLDSSSVINAPLPSGEEYLTFTIKPAEVEQKKRRKVISLEERVKRVEFHRMYLVLMMIHGAIRNLWCNDIDVSNLMKISCIDDATLKLINQDPTEKCLNSVRTRRLLDGLKKIMQAYNSRFRIICQGLIRKDWHELSIPQPRTNKVDQTTFKKLVQNFRGSRDVAAQGFVVLLRGLGLNARLVLSLQSPDYTIITPSPVAEASGLTKSEPEKRVVPNSNSRKKFLIEVNQQKEKSSNSSQLKDSPYPIFWVEVWDKYSKKWISIDPIVMQIIEVCPKRRKSSFEPPSSDLRNQLTYVIAYDKFGTVRDVTRRYSFAYNARTIRKRIEFRSLEDKNWYQKILRACSRKNKTLSTDIYEMKEFHERDLAEGMPNNSQAFKNHPLYALESHLRQNEIIYPKDESSKCGTFRSKTSTKVIPVYKRSSVHRLRSAKAWYLKGRILKIGAIALKVKQAQEPQDNIRLYAEFQTQMYIPPAIIDGKVPKNEFGNIDIYTKSMIPENGVLIPISNSHPIKLLLRAAHLIDIDYAKAIVSFDFGSTKGKQRGAPSANAREGGIVIDKGYEEAIRITLDHLVDEQEAEARAAMEASALNNWKYFLLKLRIQERLNRIHGKLPDENATQEVESDDPGGFVQDKADQEFVVEYEADQEEFVDAEEDIEGGFVVEDEEDIEGGFAVENREDNAGFASEDEEVAEGGFVVEDAEDIEGGFVIEEGETKEGVTVHQEGDNHADSSLMNTAEDDPSLFQEGGFLASDNKKDQHEEKVAKSDKIGEHHIEEPHKVAYLGNQIRTSDTDKNSQNGDSDSEEELSHDDFVYSSVEESDIEFEFSD
ncbi:DNA repair protein RAD4 [Spathaspora sp. JA1]|nr:DNA repair protein RAD4 [Spathaspora sp. JA1]